MPLITGRVAVTCAVTGGVDCDRLIKEVPAKFLHYKVLFAVGRCFESVECCIFLASLGVPPLNCYDNGHSHILQLNFTGGVRKAFSSLHLFLINYISTDSWTPVLCNSIITFLSRLSDAAGQGNPFVLV